MPTKTEFMSQLTNCKNNYVLSLAAAGVFSQIAGEDKAAEAIRHALARSQCAFGPFSVSFGQVIQLLNAQDDRDIALREFLLMALRALIKESFELIKTYCNATGQFATFEQQSWYRFLRCLRNTVSHDFTVQCKSTKDEGTWRQYSFTTAMQGCPLKLEHFGSWPGAWQLFVEVIDYVDRDVS